MTYFGPPWDDSDTGEAVEARQQLADSWVPGDDETDDE